MKKTFVTLVVLLLLSCQNIDLGPTESCMSPDPPAHPKAAIYQSLLNEYSAKGLPGISLLIRDDVGTWWGSSGKADISENIDMNTCTVSKAASITKTFVAVLAMMLAEDGVFGLDDSLEKWLPQQVLNEIANIRGCTIRQLMNHTTGIADLIDNDDFYLGVLNHPDRKWKPEELIRYAYGEAPIFKPGQSVSYSNTNYLLLAMVIDKATGKNHASLLRERVIRPLNLGNTSYYWHDNLSNVAQGYFDLYNNGTILNVTNYNTGSGNGYGGLYSNVFDLQTFIESLVRDRTLLSENSLDQMLTFTEEESGANRANGLGIFKDFLERPADQFAYGHRGRDLGYTADMFWFPNQDYTLTYLINYGTDANSSLRPVFYAFRTAIVDAIMAK